MCFMLHHGVVSSLRPRMAADYALESQPSALYNSIFFNRLIGIFAAGRMIPANPLGIYI